MKKNLALLCIVSALFIVAPILTFAASPPADPKKHTEAGKYATAVEAYEMWKAHPDKVKILDCRIPEEYAFVGHAPMAYNIPSMFWTGKWNAEKKDYILENNSNFEAMVKEKMAPGDTILIMCRSGHRSAVSVNRLTKAGFTDVYTIIDGFEGEKVDGKRNIDGWKNSTAPWTYDLDPNLIYIVK